MHIAIVTAGGAGMFCGSCMHDNTWARALEREGAEVSLIPAYTPIRLDEEDASMHRLVFGGINVYLDYRWKFWRRLPRTVTWCFDRPWLVGLATRFGVSNDAQQLGQLTLAMLQGEAGPERKATDELTDLLCRQLRPDVVCFSNVLLVGALRRLRQRFSGKIFCTLQGDDIFLNALHEPFRTQALELIHQRACEFDGYIVHSRYYRDHMSQLLGLPPEKFHLIPLGIDLKGHDGQPVPRNNGRFTVGYFARVCPEKGLQQLIEAFRLLHHEYPQTQLKAGGYLGKRDRKFFRQLRRQARELGPAFQYVGSPKTHAEKVEFLKTLDVLSVPTVYREPKGLYVLEALANGVPVVQPRHGAFPEMLEATQGGLLVSPGNAGELAEALAELMRDTPRRTELAAAGYANVRSHYDAKSMAQATLNLFRSQMPSQSAGYV